MKKVRDLGETLDLAVTVSLFLAGINFVWGLFTLEYFIGIYGIASTILNVYTGFQLRKVKMLYEERRYEEGLKKISLLIPLGYLSGFILFGIYLSGSKRNLEDIVFKKYLINAGKIISFYPPGIPKKRL